MNTRVRGQNLTYSIANHIGIAIVTGVYSADNPIPIEAELCRQYDASRPVLREAVKMLTAKGLLGARPRRGTWVQPEDRWNLLDPDVLGWLLERKFSPALLIEFTQMRLAVEPGAAMLAARVAGVVISWRKPYPQIARVSEDSAGKFMDAQIASRSAGTNCRGIHFHLFCFLDSSHQETILDSGSLRTVAGRI